MTSISLALPSTISEVAIMLQASLEFETLYKLVNQDKYLEANQYIKDNWKQLSEFFPDLLALAAQYQCHGLVQVLLNRMRADKTIPRYQQEKNLKWVMSLERAVEMEMGDITTTGAYSMLTSPGLERLIDEHSSSRRKLREGARRLKLHVI